MAALENEGVERIFRVPGEENLDTVESLRTSSIELGGHERRRLLMPGHDKATGA